MDLSGSWRAAPAREDLRRTFYEPALDDRDWPDVTVPGHWAHTPGLDEQRSVLHRRTFTMPSVENGQRRWLTIHGLAQQGDVWLNGAYVGDTDGYFVPHQFEVTHLMNDSSSHLLAIDASVPSFGDPDDRSNLLGAYLDPELSGTAKLNPGGIWREVTIHDTGSSAIHHFRVVCVDASPARARLAMRCVFDRPDGGTVVLRTRVAETTHELRHSAAVGENRVEWTIDVPEPALWWPHQLGEQVLHELTCELVVDGEVHDSRQRRTAFRTVTMRDWALHLNGVKMFAKGVVMLPTTPRPGDATSQQVAADVRAARDAGLDLIRLIAHVAHPAVYETADELGMLVWQEMPLRGVMARGVKSQAIRQTREMVDLLGHHPSVAVWCAHDEPFRRPADPSATPAIVGQQAPSWNRVVLDRAVRRTLQRTDGSRPIVAHTSVPPHLPKLDGTTSNLWFGWHDQRAADLTASIARTPRMARFVTAFGAATINPESPLLEGPRWPALDWERIAESVGSPPASLLHLVPTRAASNGPEWAKLTEKAQAELVKTTIETFRRIKYRPTGGFCAFYLADPGRAGGFGVFDSDRRAKPAWRALVESCRPVIITIDPIPEAMRAGQTISLDIHVVSDLREPIDDGEVTATVRHCDGTTDTHTWAGEVEADSVAGVACLSIKPTSPGELVIDLEFAGMANGRQVTATNQLESTVS